MEQQEPDAMRRTALAEELRPHNGETGVSRRELLAGPLALGAVGLLAGGASPANADDTTPDKAHAMPTAILGRTGMRVSRLAFGGSWHVDAEVVGLGMERGINYIDTAESYNSGQSEAAFGSILKDSGATGHSAKRKALWLVSKTHDHYHLETRLAGCLNRLQQDYVDCFYMHQIQDPKLASDPEIKAMAERMKRSGKTRFFGFSCHDEPVVECLNAAADSGFIDVIMFRYDCHYYKRDDLDRAIDRCAKAKIGLVAMKTQVGGMTLPDRYDPFKKRGLNQHQAAIKAVAVDERIASICSEMTNVDHIRQNVEAVASKLTVAEQEAIQEHARLVSHLWCRGCDHLCRAASGAGQPIAVADTLRFLMYHDHYGKRDHARSLYAQLPAEQRDAVAIAAADWRAAERACPYQVPLAKLMARAAERLG
jgi:predicted aldo/keto reductase-like oxidoreductase